MARAMRYVKAAKSSFKRIRFVSLFFLVFRPIVDDATIKLTVYHNNKNALSKGDFIGRAYISLRDLQDYDHVHRK